jgi:hypothetical protein
VRPGRFERPTYRFVVIWLHQSDQKVTWIAHPWGCTGGATIGRMDCEEREGLVPAVGGPPSPAYSGPAFEQWMLTMADDLSSLGQREVAATELP